MLSGEMLFDTYRIENPTLVSSGKIKNKIFSVNKKRFINYSNRIQDGFLFSEYNTRYKAKQFMVSKFGPIEWFLFKTIIMWIIEKILLYYFGPEVNTTQDHPNTDGRVV